MVGEAVSLAVVQVVKFALALEAEENARQDMVEQSSPSSSSSSFSTTTSTTTSSINSAATAQLRLQSHQRASFHQRQSSASCMTSALCLFSQLQSHCEAVDKEVLPWAVMSEGMQDKVRKGV
jgi:hypothetical protein